MKNTYVKLTFEDGYVIIAKGFSRHEKNIEIAKHGKIVKSEYC